MGSKKKRTKSTGGKYLLSSQELFCDCITKSSDECLIHREVGFISTCSHETDLSKNQCSNCDVDSLQVRYWNYKRGSKN